jgi:segregation and condensation protein A
MSLNERENPEVNVSGNTGKSDGSEDAGAFRVNLPVYEGPIDLLIYLVRKNELDIHEISVASVIKEYLEYVDLITMIDLETAGEFVVAASTLIKLKARSLFENEADHLEEEDEKSTKDALVKYLLEFEKLGGIAEKLSEKEGERLAVFPRGGERSRIIETMSPIIDKEPDFMLFDLLSVFREVLKNAPKISVHDVELMNVTSEMKQKEILNLLAKNGEIDFVELVSEQPRLIIVVTFIAMLELIKNRKIMVRQSEQFGKIIIYGKPTDIVEDN